MISIVLLPPVFFTICGLITGLIIAVMFNIMSGYIGGLELEIEETEEEKQHDL
ncbi:hypothetical protein [Methanolobus sp.]|uniref:hypothetical protein n=1 Tax=Methanolobus sp. TaxID=1874737 RepID=UPI0025F00024|nr:hypothetical protein [Methanolobus sp.]